MRFSQLAQYTQQQAANGSQPAGASGRYAERAPPPGGHQSLLGPRTQARRHRRLQCQRSRNSIPDTSAAPPPLSPPQPSQCRTQRAAAGGADGGAKTHWRGLAPPQLSPSVRRSLVPSQLRHAAAAAAGADGAAPAPAPAPAAAAAPAPAPATVAAAAATAAAKAARAAAERRQQRVLGVHVRLHVAQERAERHGLQHKAALPSRIRVSVFQ